MVAGPGSDWSEVPVWGCEPAALDVSVAPRCPPEPVPSAATASSSIARNTMSDRRRFRQRIASIEVFPAAFSRS